MLCLWRGGGGGFFFINEEESIADIVLFFCFLFFFLFFDWSSAVASGCVATVLCNLHFPIKKNFFLQSLQLLVFGRVM